MSDLFPFTFSWIGVVLFWKKSSGVSYLRYGSLRNHTSKRHWISSKIYLDDMQVSILRCRVSLMRSLAAPAALQSMTSSNFLGSPRSLQFDLGPLGLSPDWTSLSHDDLRVIHCLLLVGMNTRRFTPSNEFRIDQICYKQVCEHQTTLNITSEITGGGNVNNVPTSQCCFFFFISFKNKFVHCRPVHFCHPKLTRQKILECNGFTPLFMAISSSLVTLPHIPTDISWFQTSFTIKAQPTLSF